MSVLLLSQWLLVAVLLQYPGDVVGQFTAAPPTCPSGTMSFTCTVTGDSDGVTIWRVNGSSECLLSHNTEGATSTCGPDSAFTARGVTGFGTTSATSYSSTLSGTATSALDDTLVECFGPALSRQPGNMVGNSTLQILGPPSISTLSCVDLSEDVTSGAVNVTVNWTLSDGDSADFYLIDITTNAPQTLYGGLLNITTASVTQHKLTGFLARYEYNITVHGVNCGSQEGRESEPLTFTPQVPAALSSCNISSLLYNQSSGRLLFIGTTWDSMPNPVDPGAACRGPSGDITQYQIRFQTGSSVDTENVNIARCTAGRCSHTFVPPSNPPSSYDSVSVAAENVVGVGAARNCTTKIINTTNNILASEVAAVSSPTGAQLQCTFLSGFTGSARCTVQYGTDPTYMNLPYSAESTETGTAGDSVSVVLRERLNSSTVYYYTVSAVCGDVTAVVQGTFMTPIYNCSLMELWDLPATDATFLSDISLLNNNNAAQYPSCTNGSVGSVVLMNTTLTTATVAYYTGTAPGSRACFVCNNEGGYELTANERLCQSNSTWSGSPITCVPTVCTQSHLLDWHIPLFVMGAIFLVIGGVVGIFVIIFIHKNYVEMQQKCLVVTGAVFCVIFFVIGVVLWIAVGVVVSNPPDGNACDPSWRLSRDGLIIAGFVVSILILVLAIILSIMAYCLRKKKLLKKPHIGTVGKGDNFTDVQELVPKQDLTPLHMVAKKGDVNGVKELVDKIPADKRPADVNIRDTSSGVTPLHMAAEGGHVKVVNYLLGQGADVNIKDHSGQTPLHTATKGNHDYTVECLVKNSKEANINIQDDDGMAPLHVAAKGARVGIVKYLVREGANINIQDHNKQTPLHVAAKEKHDYTVKCLVKRGAKISIRDKNGRTALHVAVERGRMDIVKHLVGKGKGAGINIKDNDERTPLDIAVKNDHEDIAEFLKNAKTDTKV